VKLTYDQIIAIPPSPSGEWDDGNIRIGERKLTITSAVDRWDRHCYFAFEKRRTDHRPTLRIDVREINHGPEKKKYPYNYESIDLPWSVVEKIAEWLSRGPAPYKPRVPRVRE
jgi:hypothetical protein